jgi:large subunit ribosomal protein L17
MRHQVFGRKLNRDIKERKALFRSLISGLIIHEKITTTLPKAKAVKGLADKLITHSKDGGNSALLMVSSFLNKKDLVNKIVKEIAPRFKDKKGGYVRIVKLGKRIGDSAETARLEWSILPEIKKYEKKEIKSDKKNKVTDKKTNK